MIHDRAEVRRRWRRFIMLVGWPLFGTWLTVAACLVGLLIYMGVTA
jgi:hypothetical protein